MARKFKSVNYAASGQQTVTIDECLPPDHLARFIVMIIMQLDLSALYAHYAPTGGEPYAPEVLLGLLLYGYSTGVFSSRKLEKATSEVIPFRYIAGGLHPDHDTLATFRKHFLPEITEIFVQVLVLAHAAGVVQLGNLSLDGSKVRADASKSKAVSYGYIPKLEARLRAEVTELLALGEQADQDALPAELDIAAEVTFLKGRLVNLAQAQAVLEARAQERYEQEYAEYEAKLHARETKARESGRKARGPAPQPPTPGAREKDQYNFTDPESRIMKNSTNQGFEQQYNVQVGVDQESLLIVAHLVTNNPSDRGQALPTIDSIPDALGQPAAAALDNGYFSPDNISGLQARGIDPYIATGREPHHKSWRERFAEEPEPPPEDASPIIEMAYRLQTEIGKRIYGARKYTVEPVIGVIKEVLGFRQFSLRGLAAVAGEWCLVCLAYNLKKLHRLLSL
jgi:transposase